METSFEERCRRGWRISSWKDASTTYANRAELPPSPESPDWTERSRYLKAMERKRWQMS